MANKNQEMSEHDQPALNAGIPSADRFVLLGFIAFIAILFFTLNRLANGFFPDARLYPYVMTIIGLTLAVLAFIRVFTGKEPFADIPGSDPNSNGLQQMWVPYGKAGFYLSLILVFYVGIWFIGFRLAAVIFVFCFVRFNGQTLLSSALYATAGLIMVEILGRILQLALPGGVIW